MKKDITIQLKWLMLFMLMLFSSITQVNAHTQNTDTLSNLQEIKSLLKEAQNGTKKVFFSIAGDSKRDDAVAQEEIFYSMWLKQVGVTYGHTAITSIESNAWLENPRGLSKLVDLSNRISVNGENTIIGIALGTNDINHESIRNHNSEHLYDYTLNRLTKLIDTIKEKLPNAHLYLTEPALVSQPQLKLVYQQLSKKFSIPLVHSVLDDRMSNSRSFRWFKDDIHPLYSGSLRTMMHDFETIMPNESIEVLRAYTVKNAFSTTPEDKRGENLAKGIPINEYSCLFDTELSYGKPFKSITVPVIGGSIIKLMSDESILHNYHKALGVNEKGILNNGDDFARSNVSFGSLGTKYKFIYIPKNTTSICFNYKPNTIDAKPLDVRYVSQEEMKNHPDMSEIVKGIENVIEDDNSLSQAWHIYDDTPVGATITTINDDTKGTVVKLKGAGQDNGYVLGGWENSSQALNSTNKSIKWSMKYNEDFTIFVRVMTENGGRYLMYSNTPYDYAVDNAYVHIGLGTRLANGTWQNIERNLETDLHSNEPNNSIIAINGFYVRGSGLFDRVDFGATLPSCDISNPKVQIIKNTSDWGEINNPNKSIFCVAPGDYSLLAAIKITASGTKSEPRYIILNNGNNKHPVQLDRTQLAKYRLEFDHADYWVVDRQAYWEDINPFNPLLKLSYSSFNVFSRGLLEDTANGITLYNGSNYNTIQNFHMEKTQWSVDYATRHRPSKGYYPPYTKRIFADLMAIGLVGENTDDALIGNQIINNEIINYVDGVQLSRKPSAGEGALDASGTIISENIFYTTPILYTDGHGNFQEDGAYAVTENALDFKFGALDEKNPIIVKNNVMFGYRDDDNSTYSDLDDNGNAFVLHFVVGNIVFEENYIFDCKNGFAASGPRGSDPAMYNITLRNNIFYDMKEGIDHIYGRDYLFDGANNVLLENNIFGKVGGFSSLHAYNTEKLTIQNNKFVNTKAMSFAPSDEEKRSKDLKIMDNVFYETSYMGIPGFATKSGNIRDENSFDWSPYKTTFKIRVHTDTPIIKSMGVAPESSKIAPPTNLYFTNITNHSVTLNWTDNSHNETGFKIFIKDKNAKDKLVALTEANVESYTVRGLHPNTHYTFVLKATDDVSSMGSAAILEEDGTKTPIALSKYYTAKRVGRNGFKHPFWNEPAYVHESSTKKYKSIANRYFAVGVLSRRARALPQSGVIRSYEPTEKATWVAGGAYIVIRNYLIDKDKSKLDEAAEATYRALLTMSLVDGYEGRLFAAWGWLI